MELSEETKGDLVEFQNLQQQLQLVLIQKQQLQMQASENKKVEEELEKYSGEAYRFVGSVLVPKKSEELKKELKAERETMEVRAGALEKQESKLRERLTSLETKFRKLESSMGAAKVGEGASVSGGPSITKKGKAA